MYSLSLFPFHNLTDFELNLLFNPHDGYKYIDASVKELLLTNNSADVHNISSLEFDYYTDRHLCNLYNRIKNHF